MWAAGCLASCCASCACEACKGVASGISRRSARLAYCGLFAISLIVSWLLRDFAGPLLAKIPCKLFPICSYCVCVVLWFLYVDKITCRNCWFGWLEECDSPVFRDQHLYRYTKRRVVCHTSCTSCKLGQLSVFCRVRTHNDWCERSARPTGFLASWWLDDEVDTLVHHGHSYVLPTKWGCELLW